MKVRVFDDEERAGEAAAEEVAALVAARAEATLGLPTGRTPLPLYRALILRHREGGLELRQVRTFNLDEFVGVSPYGTSSFRAYMERHLFTQVDLMPSNIHFLDGQASDLEAECARYEAAIAAAGGLDLAILGVGANGHLAFNEPADALVARTHVARLTLQTRRSSAALFGGDVGAVPARALTMGIGTLLAARKILLIACGAGKAGAVAALLGGQVTPRMPVSFLQLHRDVSVVLDRGAAGPDLRRSRQAGG